MDVNCTLSQRFLCCIWRYNIYIAWWTNNTEENGNEEVMFRASNDGGATFEDKIKQFS
jgi:hypothetical protein